MRERSKLSFLLTELVIMILIFSVCAAVCLSVFASAREMSAESGALGKAAAWAQSAAEAYRAASGDSDAAAASIGAEATGDGFDLWLDGSWTPTERENAVYALALKDAADSGARISVTDTGEGGELFRLDVKAVAYGR